MIKFFCDRCGKEMPYPANYSSLHVYHENGKSYSIGLSVGIIDHVKDKAEICNECVRELTKKAAASTD